MKQEAKHAQVRLLPRFLGEAGGRHFTLQFQAATAPAAHIVFIPPFGEEMNRCRALVAQQARDFAASGFHCTVMDFVGTGDSEGKLAQSSLAQWYQNIELTIKTLRQEHDVPVILWGLRLGALLALDFSAQSASDIEHLILWQPVTSGSRYVTQLLRQRVAALVNNDQPPETTAQIRAQLEAGDEVEISGYFLGAPLVADIESIDLSTAAAVCSGKVFWFENADDKAGDEEPGLPTAARKLVDALQAQNNPVEVCFFSGPPLWQLHKRDAAPELVASTGKLLMHLAP